MGDLDDFFYAKLKSFNFVQCTVFACIHAVIRFTYSTMPSVNVIVPESLICHRP